MMRKVIAVILFCTLFYALPAQNDNKVKEAFSQATGYAANNEFDEALKAYDKAIELISHQTPDNAIYLDDDLLDFIIKGLAKKSIPTAEKYLREALRLRVKCIDFFREADYFDSTDEYADNMLSVYSNLGCFFAEIGLLDEAEEVMTKGITDYSHVSSRLSQSYIQAVEVLGSYYSMYRGDPAKSLSVKLDLLNQLCASFGVDDKRSRELYGRIISDYAYANAYYSFAGEKGIASQFPTIPVYSYNQIRQLVAQWEKSLGAMRLSYGDSAINRLMEEKPISFGGESSIKAGTPEYGILCQALAAIHHNQMDDFQGYSRVLISQESIPDNLLAYSRLIIASLRNHHYLNYAKGFYSLLHKKMLDEGQNVMATQVEFDCMSMLYTYGQYQDVWAYLSPIREIIESGSTVNNTPNLFVQQLTLLGMLYERYKNDIKSSISTLERAIAVAKEHPQEVDPYLVPVIYNDLGTSLSHNNEHDKAIECFNNAITIRKKWVSDNGYAEDDVWTILFEGNIADEYARKGDFSDAEKIYKKVLKFYEDNYPDRGREQLHIYDGLIYLLEEQNRVAEMKEQVERFISLQLKTFLSEASGMTKLERAEYLSGLNSGTLEIVSQFALNNALFNGLAYDAALVFKGFSINYERRMQDNILGSDDVELIDAFNNYQQAQSHNSPNTDELENRLVYLYSQHKEFASNETLSWKDVQKRLSDNDIAIEFLTCCSDAGAHVSAAALLLKKGWEEPLMIDLGEANQFSSVLNQSFNAYHDNDELYSLVWSRIEPYLKGVNRIYFSPHGAISQINIEVLKNTKGKSINQLYDVYRVSSTGNLCWDNQNRSQISYVTLYGGLNYDTSIDDLQLMSRALVDDELRSVNEEISVPSATRKGWRFLPGTEREVSQIDKILNSSHINHSLFTKEKGTEDVFKSMSGNSPTVIHVATHGFYYDEEDARNKSMKLMQDEDDPISFPLKRCGLILSGGQHAWRGEEIPGNIDDGVLLGQEIVGLNLSNTDLLVLSACQTGLGDITGEGVYGLQRAFKIAGVQTIIMSLWEVSDTATELMMTKFYTSLASGKSKRDSFDAAITEVKKEFEGPEYWAAFIMLD